MHLGIACLAHVKGIQLATHLRLNRHSWSVRVGSFRLLDIKLQIQNGIMSLSRTIFEDKFQGKAFTLPNIVLQQIFFQSNGCTLNLPQFLSDRLVWNGEINDTNGVFQTILRKSLWEAIETLTEPLQGVFVRFHGEHKEQ